MGGNIVLKKTPKKLNLAKWKGRCAVAFAKLDYSSVDNFIDDVRGDDHCRRYQVPTLCPQVIKIEGHERARRGSKSLKKIWLLT